MSRPTFQFDPEPVINNDTANITDEPDVVEDNTNSTSHLNQYLKCPICMKSFRGATQTSCGHSFCAQCLAAHLRNHQECPVCRSEIYSSHPSFVIRKMVEEHRKKKNKEWTSQERKEIRDGDAMLSQYTHRHRNRNPNRESESRADQPQVVQEWYTVNDIMSSSWNSRNIWMWVILIFVIIYVLSPIDLLPDFSGFPFTILDDLILVGWMFFFFRGIAQRFQTENAEQLLREQQQARERHIRQQQRFQQQQQRRRG